jgi:4-carboxymuconolactone decarboxylase
MRISTVSLLLGLSLASSGLAQTRFPELTPDQMTPDQKRVADAIVSGPRKTMSGPFNAWLRSPELADRLQRVGAHLRFQSSLPTKLNEFAILITARAWNAKYEWYAHYPLAIKAGLEKSVATQLAEGHRPVGMGADEAVVYDFCTELRRDKQVSDATFATTNALLGDQGVIDLIGVSGYYDLVSMTLNVARVATPPDGELPLPDLP